MRSVVSGELVTARAYEEKHIETLFAAVAESIAELAPFETWCHPGFTHDEAAEYVDWWRQTRSKGQAYYFAIEHRETGAFLGSCGLSDLCGEHKRAELGFWIRSGATGQGFATDAARVVMRFGFEDLALARIELEIAVHNAASLRVAEKLRCAREGTLRQRLILPDGPTDTVIFSLLRGESDQGANH